MRCEHGSLALGGIAGHLLWAVRVGELSLQLDLRVCCAGLTFSVCVPGAQGERGNYRAQQPHWPFSLCQSYSQKEQASRWISGTGCLDTW